MGKLSGIIGASIGSWIGWWLGSHVGLMTAFFLSVIGAGAGIYIAQRIARDYLD